MSKSFKRMPKAAAAGTSLAGYVRVPYSRLVEVFGEPDEGDGYKTAFEWVLKFKDGLIATIYDYKVSSLYGDGGLTPEQMRAWENATWHIGANHPHQIGTSTQRRITDLLQPTPPTMRSRPLSRYPKLYREAVHWVAYNDDGAEMNAAVIAEQVTVVMIADLWDVEAATIAEHVLAVRRARKEAT